MFAQQNKNISYSQLTVDFSYEAARRTSPDFVALRK